MDRELKIDENGELSIEHWESRSEDLGAKIDDRESKMGFFNFFKPGGEN